MAAIPGRSDGLPRSGPVAPRPCSWSWAGLVDGVSLKNLIPWAYADPHRKQAPSCRRVTCSSSIRVFFLPCSIFSLPGHHPVHPFPEDSRGIDSGSPFFPRREIISGTRGACIRRRTSRPREPPAQGQALTDHHGSQQPAAARRTCPLRLPGCSWHGPSIWSAPRIG